MSVSLSSFRPYFMSSETANKDYQRAFFMAVNEYARRVATGVDSKYAFQEAKELAAKTFDIASDNVGFMDLFTIFKDGCYIETCFFMCGIKVNVVVRWDSYSTFPIVS